MKYIATFYSHFGAIRFQKQCKEQGYPSRLMPVPRELSSSCGTCVAYESEYFAIENMVKEELEQIVCQEEDGYQVLYRAANS